LLAVTALVGFLIALDLSSLALPGRESRVSPAMMIRSTTAADAVLSLRAP